MLQRIPVLKEVSYRQYIENYEKHPEDYLRQFVVGDDVNTSEEIAEEVNNSIEDNYNTDKHKYYKVIGIISSKEMEEDIDKLYKDSLLN